MKPVITLLFIVLSLQQVQAQENAADTTSPEQWQHGENNMQYKIVKSDTGRPLWHGSYMQMHVKQVYSGAMDSLLMDTRDGYPRTQLFDSISTPPEFYDIISHLKTGDSLVIKIPTENLLKDISQVMPPFIKKGDYVYTSVKLLNIFETKEMADSANLQEAILARPRMYAKELAAVEKEMAENKTRIDADGKLIEAFLLRNKIKARKTKWGTYIVVTKGGTGKPIDYTCTATVNYTGKVMKTGKIIDSNTMPSFQHVSPMEVDMSQLSAVILGFYDGLLQLKKGASARLYIPSSLAYGNAGMGKSVKPNEILVFEIKVLTVKELK